MALLTGNKRYRINEFKNLVLQVEYIFKEYYPRLGVRDCKRWRDATVEDITEGNVV